MLSYYSQILTLKDKEPIRRYLNDSVSVRLGQLVEPHEIIGLHKKTLGFRVFPLAKILSVEAGKVEKYLLKNIGAYVYKGEVIAQRLAWGGLKKTVFISPIDAIIKNLNRQTGTLVLEFIPELVKVPSGVEGTVVAISPGQKVIIESSALFLKTKIGLGQRREGVLEVIADPAIPIPLSSINDGLAGKILVGGSLLTREVLYRLISARVKGIVCGGINFADFSPLTGKRKTFEDVGLTILIVHGFGAISLSEQVYQMLKSLSGSEAIISGFSKQLLIPLRKEKMSSFSTLSKSKADFSWAQRPEVGTRVRLLSSGQFQLSGTIIKLNKEKVALESGLLTSVVSVKLDNGEEVQMPYQNLEIGQPDF